MKINWYPGHMAKAKRLLQDQLVRVDVVIELCDARLPHATRNPDLNRLIGNKKRIVILNKADLADPEQTAKWLNHFNNQDFFAKAYTSTGSRPTQPLQWIEQASREIVERAAQKGIRKVVRVMVAGVPNVGKSTFINHLHGTGITRVADKPGVTRSNQWVKVGPYLELLDTPGLLWPRLDDQLSARRLGYIGSIRDQVVDIEMLAINLLEDLMHVSADSVMKRYKIKDANLRGPALLDAACFGRGFLLKGGIADTERGCVVVLDEFRGGMLGRITLEKQEDENIPSTKRLTIPGATDQETKDDDRDTQES